MLLAIDAGNTRIKWGLFDNNGNLSDTGSCLHDAISTEVLPTSDQAIIASVANAAVLKALNARLNNQPITIAKPTKSCSNLINDYADITQLGIDRWASAIAACELTKAPCLIVNAGTAITVDAIELRSQQAHFIGGWIAPGLHTMQQTLAQNTAQLDIFDGNQRFDTKNAVLGFGLDTQTSIKNGTMAAAIGMIQLGAAILSSSKDKPANIIISGGDGKFIAKYCAQQGIKVQTDEHLVLKGLYAIHQSNN